VRRSSILELMLLAALAMPPMPTCADGPPVVTILEGGATVYRGSWKFDALPGVPIQADDLVQTGGNSLIRIEYDDGARIDLGPTTRAQLNHPTAVRISRPALYVLNGWIKLDVGAARQLPPARFATPAFDASGITGSVLDRIGADGDAIFVELGNARIAPRLGPALSPSTLTTGDYVAVGRDGRIDVDARPAKDFVAQLPRAFRDSIPSQLAHFRGHELEEPPAQAFTYGQVEAWIDAEPAIRRQFVQTWRSKLQEPSFRRELAAKLNRHPEWGPLLFPELYARKRPPDAPAPFPPTRP
jgi:hypothetical protein